MWKVWIWKSYFLKTLNTFICEGLGRIYLKNNIENLLLNYLQLKGRTVISFVLEGLKTVLVSFGCDK